MGEGENHEEKTLNHYLQKTPIFMPFLIYKASNVAMLSRYLP